MHIPTQTAPAVLRTPMVCVYADAALQLIWLFVNIDRGEVSQQSENPQQP
jgi:hypothetical protein